MSALDWIGSGSLWSQERLLQARHFYSPVAAKLPAAAAFSRWTAAAAVQPELVVARGLAGLPEDELAALEAEFVRSPDRPRANWRRQAVLTGAVLTLLGAVGFAAAESQGIAGQTGLVLSVACMLAGVAVGAVSAVAGFATMHLDISHGSVGLLVGQLDEQHPWIYKTLHFLCDPHAESYRQRVIAERGCLRGLDYVTIREIVSANQLLACTRSTRSVVEQIHQSSPTDHSKHKTVFRFPSGVDRSRRLTDMRQDAGPSPQADGVAGYPRP
jgi:hypothetical protein